MGCDCLNRLWPKPGQHSWGLGCSAGSRTAELAGINNPRVQHLVLYGMEITIHKLTAHLSSYTELNFLPNSSTMSPFLSLACCSYLLNGSTEIPKFCREGSPMAKHTSRIKQQPDHLLNKTSACSFQQFQIQQEKLVWLAWCGCNSLYENYSPNNKLWGLLLAKRSLMV